MRPSFCICRSRREHLSMIWFLLLLIAVCNADVPCGLPSGCLCNSPIIFRLECSNISIFPSFDPIIKPGVLSISIHETKLVDMNPFLQRDWMRLKELHFRNNPLLSCAIIDSLRRPGLKIYSDCQTPQRHNIDIISTVLGGVSIVFTLLTIVAVFLKRQRRPSTTYELAKL